MAEGHAENPYSDQNGVDQATIMNINEDILDQTHHQPISDSIHQNADDAGAPVEIQNHNN